MKPSLNIVADNSFNRLHFPEGKYLHRTLIVRQNHSSEMMFTMHRRENTNNLEVLKLAILLRSMGIKMTMWGTLNQLSLFSIFADEVILRDSPDATADIYDDVSDPTRHTTYREYPFPSGFQIIDLSRKEVLEDGRPEQPWMAKALREVSDEHVVREFAWPAVTVRDSSVELFTRIQSTMPIRAIVCEIKQFTGCAGLQFSEAIGGLFTVHGRSWLRDLARKCGQHYMAVQYLASDYLEWSWVCYGGSSNLFAFLPVKTLLLSDAYVWPELSRKLALARYPEQRVFPLINEEQNSLFGMTPEMMQKVRNFTGQK